ncbi:GntR family transcriptional regulator [Dethiosulfovibrio sp. F2B]|uniref:GntR family transcriptional regulator n=1 Tax=Dethiosulfovibrio faecalis TaxID=2720018 RepID=UPI001F2C465B|nr:GntR family transcriptional regulator [Dethiosulfovibrio faecalis]MCF4151655.1 GntR family transcriptional regulator [Dethiosulfovibrio faecalis]
MPLLSKAKEIKIKPVREIVYEHIRQAIVGGELEPGTRFTDGEIATEFNISRTPVREAIQKLETEGLIERVPMKGNVVKGLLPKDVAQIFALRKALECLAVRYVAVNATEEELCRIRATLDQAKTYMNTLQGDALADAYVLIVARYNKAMFEASHAPRVVDLIWSHREMLDRYRVVRIVIAKRLHESYSTREQMYGYFADRKPDDAAILWASHIDRSYRIWTEVIGCSEDIGPHDYM